MECSCFLLFLINFLCVLITPLAKVIVNYWTFSSTNVWLQAFILNHLCITLTFLINSCFTKRFSQHSVPDLFDFQFRNDHLISLDLLASDCAEFFVPLVEHSGHITMSWIILSHKVILHHFDVLTLFCSQ